MIRHQNTLRKTCFILLMLMVVSQIFSACSAEIDLAEKPEAQIEQTASYVLEKNAPIQANSAGNDWILFAMLQSGNKISKEYVSEYIDAVRALIKKNNGKAGEYATDSIKLSMVIHAAGENPEDVDGYNLIKVADDFRYVTEQGLNGPMYALIGARFCGYKLKNETRYINYLLSHQTKGGGFTYGEDAFIDMTAMGIAALSRYRDRPEVDRALKLCEKRLDQKLEAVKDTEEEENCEALSQAIIAKTMLKRDMSKSGLIERLKKYKKGKAFAHVKSGEESDIATEQAMLALAAVAIRNRGGVLYEKQDI